MKLARRCFIDSAAVTVLPHVILSQFISRTLTVGLREINACNGTIYVSDDVVNASKDIWEKDQVFVSYQYAVVQPYTNFGVEVFTLPST